MKYGAGFAALPFSLLTLGASAQDDAFTLGQITVTATRLQQETLADAVVDRNELWTFNTNTLDDAIKLIPGVSSTLITGGRRNERDIFVRGFGRWQVPLSIDGIRIYLPADNRLDFNRFLTSDLAEIQVQKGYASVLDGPGGMGGAINLVTRKPTKELEADFQSSATFGGDGYQGWNSTATIGTRQERYYLQTGGSLLDTDHFSVSDDFSPTTIEDGGERNRSANRDWRVNVKAGFTPNDTDEYSLSYVTQSGRKGAPLNVLVSPPNPPNSYWDWPWWDIKNLYWLSNTKLGADSYLKTRLFYNTFDNALYAYDDATYTTQSANGRFQSIYEDSGYGGSIEAGTVLSSRNTLKLAVHYRRDQHAERNLNRPTSPTFSSVEPWQKTDENTWSVALENTFRPTADWDVIVGASYDKNDLQLAQEFNTTAGLFAYPTGGSSAVNGQGAVHWRYSETSELHASVSSRTRFPTIFERFSTRFGTAIPNPDLGTERGTNYEVGWQGRPTADSSLSAAVFYNDVRNLIQTVVVVASPQQTQTQNVGDGEFYGVELAGDTQIGARIKLGANYTFMKRKIVDALQPTFQPVGTPENQGLLYVSYRPIDSLTVMPSLEVADSRWSDVTGGGYLKVGSYTLANLQAQYTRGSFDVVVGGRNLLDKNYQLAWGFPEAGRTWFAKFRVSY